MLKLDEHDAGSRIRIVEEPKEGVNRLLQHPLLVADNDFGSTQVEQLFEPVVAVNDSPVEIVEV